MFKFGLVQAWEFFAFNYPTCHILNVRYKHKMKLIKKFFKLLLFILFLGIISCSIGIIWLKNYSWEKISTQTEMKDNGLKILNTDKLPDNFYQVYDINN